YSVAQTAHGSDYRDSSVSHGNQLAEPAWLEFRRHQEEIHARVDLVGQQIAKRQFGSNFTGMGMGEIPQRLFVPGRTCSQDHNLNILLYKALCGFYQYVHALLLEKPAHKPKDRNLGPPVQSESGHKGPLVLHSLSEALYIIV